MPDKIINHVVIDGQPGKFYAPNVLTGLEETEAVSELKSDLTAIGESTSVTIQSGSPVKVAYSFLKGRAYKVTNDSNGSVNIRVDDSDGNTTVLQNSVASGDSYEFTCTADNWVKLNLYFASTGTCLFETKDSGVWQTLSDLEDSVADVQDLESDVYDIEYASGVYRNICNPSDYIDGSVWRSSGTYSASGYFRLEIPVIAGHKYTIANCHTSYSYWCDNSDNRTAIGNGVFTAPSTCVSLKLSGKTVNGDIVVLDTDYSGTVTATAFPYGSWFCKTDYDTIISEIKSTVRTVDYTTVSMFPTIAVIGDSFESGGIYIDADNGPYGAFYDYSWPAIMQRRCGSTINNYSAASLSTRTWLTNTEKGLSKALSDDASDIYMIFLGINDSSLYSDDTSYLGTSDDIGTEEDTFYGNYSRIVDQMQTHAPDAKMIFVIPPSAMQPAITSAITALATYYDVPIITSSDDEFFSSDFFDDNRATGHPVAITYAGMALAYERLISLCIQANTTYFFDVH